MRRQSCQQDGAEQQRKRAAPPGHVCASAHGGVSGAQSRFAGADCPAGQPCRPADRRARCPADRRAHCRADCRVESVHVSPPSLAAVYAPGRFFMRAGGLPCGGFAPCIPGAEPGRRLQPQQKRYPAGGLPCLPPANPAFPEAAGGLAFFAACRPSLSLPFCPLSPPAPFPGGEGGD